MDNRNEQWLRQYLELPNDIPSWHTIKRVFDIINPKQFEKCFVEWIKEVIQMGTGMKKDSVVAIDDKIMRGMILIVAINTISCQKDIPTKIVNDNKADYILSLKGNHSLLPEEVETYFKDALEGD